MCRPRLLVARFSPLTVQVMATTFTHEGCTQCPSRATVFELHTAHLSHPDKSLAAALTAADHVSAAEFAHLAGVLSTRVATLRRAKDVGAALSHASRRTSLPTIEDSLPRLASVVLDWESKVARHARVKTVDEALCSYAMSVMEMVSLAPMYPPPGPLGADQELEQFTAALATAPRISDALDDARWSRLVPVLGELTRSWDELQRVEPAMGPFAASVRRAGLDRGVPWVIAVDLLSRNDGEALLPSSLDSGFLGDLEPGLLATVRSNVAQLSLPDRVNLVALSQGWSGSTRELLSAFDDALAPRRVVTTVRPSGLSSTSRSF